MIVDGVVDAGDDNGSEMACGFIYAVVIVLLNPPATPPPLSLPPSILALALSIRLPSIRALQPAYCIYINITLGSSVVPP